MKAAEDMPTSCLPVSVPYTAPCGCRLVRLKEEEQQDGWGSPGYLTTLLHPCYTLSHHPPAYPPSWTGIATNGAGWTEGVVDPLIVELLNEDDDD